MVYGYIVLRKKNGNDGPQFPVHKSVKIGRGTHCDVRIHVQSVSEQHCFILVEKRKRAVIQNLSSSSQTLVNGIPVGKSGNTLKHQDFITVGERSFRWLYSESSPFFQGKKGSAQKRRKSEADSAQGSQNIAVVNPLFHKRRTVGAAFTYSESSCTPKTAADPHFEKAKKSTGGKKVIASTPIPSSAPSGKYSSRHVVTKSKILQGQTPETLKSALKSPAVSSNVVGGSLFEVTSTSHSPVRESSVLKTPVPKTLTSLSATPASISSPVKTLVRKLSTSKTSGDTKAAPITRPIRKSLPSLTATSHISQTLARKSLPRKSVSRKTSSQTPAKTSNVKMPGNPSPKLKSKSSKTPGSGRKSKAQKRRLSSPPTPASKRLKIESPKSIDKKKMAVLMGIHGKSRKMAGSSALSNVKFVLSTRKTPIVKALKTPHSSTSKKNCAQQLSTSKTKSSSKKPRRLLYSEMLKKKAVQKANAVARKLAPVQKASTRAVNRKLVVPKMFEESPGTFKFGSTGHVDSPETIFVGRRVAERLFVTNQGQKVPMALKRHQESVNLSGIAESYDTCSKIITKSPGRPNVILKSSPFRSKSTPPGSPAATKSSFRPCSPPLICQVSSVAENHSIKNQKTLSTVKRNSNGKKVTPVKPSTPARKGSVSSPSSTKASGNTQTKMSRASGSVSQKKPSKTPPFRKTLSSSGSRRQRSLLTSTPAVRRNKDSLADSLFESPSSLLAAQISAPQSPASGRKSRMDMVALSTSHVYSPQASPGKSSLKSSPSKSPPSDGPSKNLSVSFSDSIRIKMLVPGSKRSLNTTAPLRSPASILGEDDSAATPDQTTFDFSSVKTPNVPKEMFVSSILSSGASSSGLASGSAKRKAKVVRTPQDELGNLHGVRRLMKTPASPPGYVDVKGVKRLMSNVCKTPTYLAVEGVKKLFGDATVAASNGLSNFAGVRELFASPSPKPNRKKPLNAIPRSTSRKSSPVAKIQAEVESKGRSSSDSPSRATRGSFSLNASSEKQSSRTGSSPARVSVTYSPKLVVDTLESTPFNFSGRVTRKASKLIVVSQSESSKGASQEQVLKEKLTSAGQGRMSVGGTPKKSNKKEVKSQPRRNKSIDTSPIVQSSPKRRTRKAVKDVSGDAISPLLEPKTMRTRRGAKQTILKPETSPLTKNGSKKSAKDTEIVSKIAVQESSPSLKSMGKARSSRRAPLKPSPPSESVMTKCTTRKGAKTSQTSVKSSKTKLNKLELSPSNVGILTPIKKTRRDLTLSASPVDSLPKRVTRRTGKEVLSTQKASTEHKNNLQKRKLSSDTTPSKKAKTTSKNDNLSSSSDKDEKKNTRRKRGESQKNEVHLKGVSPRQKAETLSPRRTRSRK